MTVNYCTRLDTNRIDVQLQWSSTRAPLRDNSGCTQT